MDGKSYFKKKRGNVVFSSLLAALSGVILLALQQNAYDLADAQTSSMEKVITIADNGDVRFQENLNRSFSTRVFFQLACLCTYYLQ